MPSSIKHFVSLLLLCAVAGLAGGCAARSVKADRSGEPAEKFGPAVAPKTASPGPRIEIKPNSPADTVRAFYSHLREDRFRDGLFLTNLRPAIESLTDSELRELKLDFNAIGRQIPHEIEINGEISSGNRATVTAKLPDNETGSLRTQEVQLRRDGEHWVILTVDESAEENIRAEGARYFFNLRLATHHREAQEMLNRISRAQMVYAAQNQGLFGDLPALLEKGFIPDDIRTPDSTGYRYGITVAADRKGYSASAEPAEPGKTGVFSYLLEPDKNGVPVIKEQKNGGKMPVN